MKWILVYVLIFNNGTSVTGNIKFEDRESCGVAQNRIAAEYYVNPRKNLLINQDLSYIDCFPAENARVFLENKD